MFHFVQSRGSHEKSLVEIIDSDFFGLNRCFLVRSNSFYFQLFDEKNESPSFHRVDWHMAEGNDAARIQD